MTGHGPTPDLSRRERDVLRLASEGLTDQGIAHRIGIGVGTVNTYWGRIRAKLGPLNRAELAAGFARDVATADMDRLIAENARLLAELQDHTRHESELRGAVAKMRSIVDNAPDAILVVDAAGNVKLANTSAEDLLGYGSGELIGLHLRALVPRRFHGKHNRLRRQYMEHPEKRKMGAHLATSAVRKDGTEFEISANLNAFEVAEGTLVTCIMRAAN